MSLAARRSSHLKEKLVMRLGCILVTFSVLASLVLEPPKAKAFVMTSSAVTSLASGFLSACGLTPVVSGMGSSSEVNGSVARLIQDFLNEEVSGISVADWALSFGEIGLAVKDKKIVIPKPFAEKLGKFARWVAGKYGTQAGVNVVYGITSAYVTLADGTKFYLCTNYDRSAQRFLNPGTPIVRSLSSFPIVFSTGAEIRTIDESEYRIGLFNPDGSLVCTMSLKISWSYSDRWPMYLGGSSQYLYFMRPTLSTHSLFTSVSNFEIGDVISVDESLSLDVAETMQEVLDRLTALEEGQSIALDVGATQSMEIQDILQGILDAILAGDLAASAEIVDTAEVPVEPEEPDPPVVPVVPSGLDKLGAALTSRFPFSIPWDVYKGVTLLAAPPKAPYFEVDFLAPIAYRVGGWKGSTKIVLDFSEYEIIGQVCRWTSTVGFCLMLASGTKRLIWTA